LDSPKISSTTPNDARTTLSHRSAAAAASSIHSPVRSFAGGIAAGTVDITGVLSPIRETSSVAAARGPLTTPTTSYGDLLFSPIRTSESVIAKIPSITYTDTTPDPASILKTVELPHKNLSTEFEQLLLNKENVKPSHDPEGKITRENIVEFKESIFKVDDNEINGNKIETNQIMTPVSGTTSIKRSQTPSSTKSMANEGSKITNTPSRSMSRTNPSSPRRRQFMRQLQSADLIENDTPTIQEGTETLATKQLPTLERNDTAPVGGELQMSLIRSCVRDVIEEFEENVNKRFMNLHSHLVKEFIQQQDLMKKLFKVHSLNDELIQEVHRLQEENRHLRANY